ncbi:MAG: regulatory protein RecX, partial [Solirubrobacteraceae bacterium]
MRLDDPESRVQHAREEAWRALDRRERTVAELARLLAGKRIEPSAIEAVVAELCEQGYLDDASYARRFAEDRRRLDGWGAERIERRLLSLGIDRELIAAAVGAQAHEEELAAALELLARRFPHPP